MNMLIISIILNKWMDMKDLMGLNFGKSMVL